MLGGIALYERGYNNIDEPQNRQSEGLSLEKSKKIAQTIVGGHYSELASNAKGFFDSINPINISNSGQNSYGTFKL